MSFNMNNLTVPANLNGPNLGGGIQGISPKQSITNYRGGDDALTRRIVTKSWNTTYASGNVNGLDRVITPFRAVKNLGDYLSRKNYSCGGPNPTNASRPGYKSRIGNLINVCDGTGIPASSTNVKFVPDSSDYTTFKRQQAANRMYNDNSFGGDQNNASYVPMMRVRRF
jgi:hypothetical protein